MSHTDFVTEMPEGFRIIGKTATCPAAAIECPEKASMAFSSTLK